MTLPPTPHLLEWAGYTLVGLALLQAGVATWSTWQRRLVDHRTAEAAARLFGQRADLILRRAAARADREVFSWNGYRKFVVARKIPECDGVWSFELRPHDGRPLAPFLPGQYLTFQIKRPGDDRPLIRCYSLSDGLNRTDCYRISIKTVPAPPGSTHPPGRSSTWFNETVTEGDILDVKAPAGQFHLDHWRDHPIVLIAGGIGITPMMSMLNTLSAGDVIRPVWLFYGVHNRNGHAFAERLAELRTAHPNIRIVTFYGAATPTCVKGRDYDETGHITGERLRAYLPSNNFEFFICGPPPMMESVTADLRAWGVPDEQIRFEAFGPATVRTKGTGGGGETKPEAASEAVNVEVVFSRAGKTVSWQGGRTSLLDLAESNGIAIESGCRAGNCGTCAVAIKEGKVDYLSAPGNPPAAGTCLTCIAAPASRLVLDT